ncbi:MAG: signal peptidase I, partial [Holophagales bacterium]|nr:signal peptidase I [Holophagales bacterium]
MQADPARTDPARTDTTGTAPESIAPDGGVPDPALPRVAEGSRPPEGLGGGPEGVTAGDTSAPQDLSGEPGAAATGPSWNGEPVPRASVPGGGAWRFKGGLFWKEWVKPLMVIGLVMFSFRSAVADWNDVPTGSMKPTILEGDRIFINKVAYDLKVPFTTIRIAQWDDPEWGDVVVLRSPEDGKRLVKRVVGLPGDTIEVRGIYLFRNSERAVYSELDPLVVSQIDPTEQPGYLFATELVEGRGHPIMSALRGSFATSGPWVVEPDHYFVMGDNR